jgi:hypothetical protein
MHCAYTVFVSCHAFHEDKDSMLAGRSARSSCWKGSTGQGRRNMMRKPHRTYGDLRFV